MIKSLKRFMAQSSVKKSNAGILQKDGLYREIPLYRHKAGSTGFEIKSMRWNDGRKRIDTKAL
jgi:hypothetical protein